MVLAVTELVLFIVAPMFWIYDQNSVENTVMFLFLLSSTYTAPRHYSHTASLGNMPGVHKKLVGTQMGQLTPDHQRNIHIIQQHIHLREKNNEEKGIWSYAACTPR